MSNLPPINSPLIFNNGSFPRCLGTLRETRGEGQYLQLGVEYDGRLYWIYPSELSASDNPRFSAGIFARLSQRRKFTRASIDEYAIIGAHWARLRSEDPDRQVGAVALNRENRPIAAACNGLAKGVTLPPEIMRDREKRRPYMLHAEQNLVALFTRGEAMLVALTISPCSSCAAVLSAHGVERVIYSKIYDKDPEGVRMLEMHGIEHGLVPLRGGWE